MSTVSMVKLDPQLLVALGLGPEFEIPVREDRLEEITTRVEVDFEGLVDEMIAVVTDFPALEPRYASAIAALGYFAGIGLSRRGLYVIAIPYFAKALARDAGNLSIRIHLALAYQAAGRLQEALEQYVFILDEPDVEVSPWLVQAACRAAFELGDYLTAEAILATAEHALFEDDAYWEMRSEVQRRAGLVPPRKTGASTAARAAALAILADARITDVLVCPTCLAMVALGTETCPECAQSVGGGLGPANREGTLPPLDLTQFVKPASREGSGPAAAESPVATPTPTPVASSTCPHCAAEVAVGAKFCGKCGKLTEPPAPAPASGPKFCGKCGAPSAPGTKFCGGCGNPIGG